MTALSPELQRQAATKNDKRSHQCSYCSKNFAQGSRLRRHERTHTGVKPYKCNHCDKYFGNSSHLKRHKATHTVEKPFKCSKCDECFHYSEDHNQHELTHSNETVQLQQQSTEKECDTVSHNEDLGDGCQTESKADASHAEHDFFSSENHTSCNDEHNGVVEKPCPEQSLPQMEHELNVTSNEDYLCYRSQPNVGTGNIEQGSCTSEGHSMHEQCDTS